jgi:hypothetical protein
MTLIYEQLLNSQDNKVKLIIQSLNGFSIYYGYVIGLDDNAVLLQLDNQDKKITIKLNVITEVVVYEN